MVMQVLGTTLRNPRLAPLLTILPDGDLKDENSAAQHCTEHRLVIMTKGRMDTECATGSKYGISYISKAALALL